MLTLTMNKQLQKAVDAEAIDWALIDEKVREK